MRNPPIDTILVDLDGVLVNWVRAVCELYGLNYGEVLRGWTDGSWDLAARLGMSKNEMYAGIDDWGVAFWTGIPDFPWTVDMLRWLNGLKRQHGIRWYICSTPSRNPSSVAGKVEWVRKRLKDKRKYVLTPHKHLLARETSILIDDKGENISAFTRAGGKGVLFPRPGNRRGLVSGTLGVVKDEVQAIIDGLI